MNISAKTAIHRKKMSAPVRELFEDYLYGDNYARVLDFGCGRGKDVEEIRKVDLFKEVVGYDPNFQPKTPKGKFHLVLMTYVVNVIQHEAIRDIAITTAWEYVRKGGQLVIVTRSRREVFQEYVRGKWDIAGKGYITHSGTYQRGYSPKQLDTLVCDLLNKVRTVQYGRMKCGASMVIVTKG